MKHGEERFQFVNPPFFWHVLALPQALDDGADIENITEMLTSALLANDDDTKT